MRLFIAYWTIGCLLFGADTGLHKKRCPAFEPKVSEAVASIATWPAAFGYVAFNRDLPKCEGEP